MFLPLSFITGLLGAHIGGIPGQDSPWGLAVLVGLLAGVQLVLFWRMRWL